MDHHRNHQHGIERLIARFVDAFRIPENLNHYAPEDLERAQRRFIRFCLQEGPAGPRVRG